MLPDGAAGSNGSVFPGDDPLGGLLWFCQSGYIAAEVHRRPTLNRLGLQ
jgi:hypothetical protein